MPVRSRAQEAAEAATATGPVTRLVPISAESEVSTAPTLRNRGSEQKPPGRGARPCPPSVPRVQRVLRTSSSRVVSGHGARFGGTAPTVCLPLPACPVPLRRTSDPLQHYRA
ncbi:hypothetical protein GCM10010420_23270 [Streptomyces glaucosporus]|uniref:Uncharacterized protein n=1 Tax=Streptomyces glaucosporus TaxID=284044 RepID=A0ABP5V8Z8_9ACTN